jgi:membrane protease YdiL (CAAX protease family)
LSLATNQPDAWFGLGCCHYYRRDYQSAAESFRECTLAEPTNYDGHVWLGDSLERLGRHDQAAAAFERALRLRPHDYEAALWRGISLIESFRFEEAAPNLEEALEVRPGEQRVRWLLLASYLATGQMDKIPRLHLGISLPLSILLVVSYLPAVAFLFRKSLRLQPRPSPGIGFALAWCGVTILGENVLFTPLLFIFRWPLSPALGVGVSLSVLPLIAAALWGFARQPWGRPFAWPPRMPGWKLLFAVLGGVLGVCLFSSGYARTVEHVTGKAMPDQGIISWLGSNLQGWPWLALVGVGLAAPAGEEILFRGLLFGALTRWLSSGWTVVVTAAIFALAHLQLMYFAPIFAVGLLLGWTRHKSEGLGLPILVHCLNNSVCFIIAMQRSTNH